MPDQFFPKRPDSRPAIYAYEDTNPQYNGLLKVGYTTVGADNRVAQQYPTARPGKLPYRVVLEESAMRSDGTSFKDHEVHRMLRNMGVDNAKGEWFGCTARQVKSAIMAVRNGEQAEGERDQDFAMRPEQQEAVKKTAAYFRSFDGDREPNVLWNAKMRFGKTFAAYQLALEMGWTKVLVLTFKPAVQSAWEDDLMRHVDFAGWQFIKPGGLSYEEADKSRSLVCFGSFQDYLGRNHKTGGIKAKNEWVHATNWDCVIFDEYHYGAWRDNAKELFEAESPDEAKFLEGEGMQSFKNREFDQDILPITTNHYLFLSGTPFRAMASGEFIEDQIFNWTYSNEQSAKQDWQGDDNPYAALPRMVMLTYQLPEEIRNVALQGEFNEFDLNTFFAAEGDGDSARFKYEDEVQKWLDLIRGAYKEQTADTLKLGSKKPPMPFSDARLLHLLTHTFWFLPSVASCYAMKNVMDRRQNRFYHDYEIVVAAGNPAGIGAKALPPVQQAMGDPLKTKTITLSCGKLTTGVTVKPWSGILMLRNSSSPETYFQAAFRVQSPWTVKNMGGTTPNTETIIKQECYVFDFAPDRALRQIADYSCRLSVDEASPEQKVAEFINFLPVLAYDGSSMKQVDAAGILDMALSGTTATLLARRWESALLVNVDNDTLKRVLDNKQALDALSNIEGFRSLNETIETIINKSESVKKVKKEKNDDEDLTPNEKKQLTEEEKEYKRLRKQVQEKLIKFATRIPVFMYLTDYRERTLRDVITQLEPGLFKKVTGLTIKDFELLVSLGVFNGGLMNDAVYKFKRYEDASLGYTGINKHAGEEDIGLYDTVLSQDEAKMAYENVPAE
jgi:hypothetical protein